MRWVTPKSRASIRTVAWITVGFWISVVWCGTTDADDNRPLYVELIEVEPGIVRLGLRVPPSVPVFNQPKILLPPGCVPQPRALAQSGVARRIDREIDYSFFRCDEELAGKTIEIHYPNPQAIAAVVRMTRLSGWTHTEVLQPGVDRWQVPAAETQSSVASDYFWLGVHHIWAGTDHLLFLVCLISIAGSFGRIAATITGFTIAHSATLALSALDMVRLPVPPIEAAIALSVVFLATEVVKGDRDRLTWRYPITVSSAFGLLHGLGFAAVLNEIGLPQTELATGLLCFNLGVEVGQILFAAVVLMLLEIARRVAARLQVGAIANVRLQQSLGYAVGIVAAFWLCERVANFSYTIATR